MPFRHHLLSDKKWIKATDSPKEISEKLIGISTSPEGNANIYKLIEKIGLIDFLPYICLLKSTQKIQQQEQLFELICKELNWKFVPMKK